MIAFQLKPFVLMIGSHRQPGSAEVLLGRSLHGQPPAVIDSRYKIRAAARLPPKK